MARSFDRILEIHLHKFHNHENLIGIVTDHHFPDGDDAFMAEIEQHTDFSQCRDGKSLLGQSFVEFDLLECHNFTAGSVLRLPYNSIRPLIESSYSIV